MCKYKTLEVQAMHYTVKKSENYNDIRAVENNSKNTHAFVAATDSPQLCKVSLVFSILFTAKLKNLQTKTRLQPKPQPVTEAKS